jgi:hypothetical protein
MPQIMEYKSMYDTLLKFERKKSLDSIIQRRKKKVKQRDAKRPEKTVAIRRFFVK